MTKTVCDICGCDMWARDNKRSSRETWKELYEAAMAVHNEMGDCK